MRLNYLYNFKNTIRFFMNIEDLDYSDVDLGHISWTKPFNFRIRKDDNSFRTLRIPNIYNFKAAYDYYEANIHDGNFDLNNLEGLDSNKRMEISYELGEFKEKSYDKWQQIDYNMLIKYDLLLRYDIKSFYDNIYTHYIFKGISNDNISDSSLFRMYSGRTSGIIMGNYISLYAAEVLSSKISSELKSRLENVDCYFSYFSDDFYIFVNHSDKERVTKIFDEVLEKFNLNKNEEKIKIYDYLSYTNDNVIEKYWKTIAKIIREKKYYQSLEIASGKLEKNNNLGFTNQLIYRLNKLDEYKKQKVFIVNFFKSRFFRKIDFSNTYFNEYIYHQILFLIKKFPEILLYIDSIIDSFEEFKNNSFKETIIRFYNNSLETNYHDEQLYYYYFINKLGITDKIKNKETRKKVLNSDNHVLISYYIMNNMFETEEINIIKNYADEEYWLEYYYIILNDSDLYLDLENSVMKYLIPEKASRHDMILPYKNFYMKNLSHRRNILYDIHEVSNVIEEYFFVKYPIKEEAESSGAIITEEYPF